MIGSRIHFDDRGADAALRSIASRSDRATRQAVLDAAHAVQREAMRHASGRPGPNVKTGAHRRSFVVVGPERVANGRWEARVGPTMVYSRALEFGHPNWSGAKYPSLGPAMTWARTGGVSRIFRDAWARS